MRLVEIKLSKYVRLALSEHCVQTESANKIWSGDTSCFYSGIMSVAPASIVSSQEEMQ